ncbi:MAG: hypothetical protein P1V97_25675 [Planctomycetota bacterium]|nr:hypothetical protein [Planctomycetota bacterium]
MNEPKDMNRTPDSIPGHSAPPLAFPHGYIGRILAISVIGSVLLISFLVLMGHSSDEAKTDGGSVVRETKRLLKEANIFMRKFDHAERAGHESDRAKYIVLAHGRYNQVMRSVDSLRRPPYTDKNGEWLPGYEQFEKIEGEAGQALHDISKTAHRDSFEDTPEDKIQRKLYSHFKTAKSSFAQLEAAEIYNHEEDRRRFIRLSRSEFHAVVSQLRLLRKIPFADSDGHWTPTYDQFEKMEKEATEKLVSIAKRAYVGDFD